MFKNIVFRILAALVLLAAIAGIASFAFNAGMARGAVLNLQLPANGTQVVPNAYGWGMPGMRPFPVFHMGIGAIVLPLFLLFLAFGAFRRMLWGSRMGWHHHPMMHHNGCGEKGPGSPDFVPPMFAEWHRRSHEQPENGKKVE